MNEVLDDQQTDGLTLATTTIHVQYPTIEFDVPRRLDAYTTSVIITFGLTGSFCKPIVPLPKTDMVLTHCYEFRNEDEHFEKADLLEQTKFASTENDTQGHTGSTDASEPCTHDFVSVFDNPLDALEVSVHMMTKHSILHLFDKVQVKM